MTASAQLCGELFPIGEEKVSCRVQRGGGEGQQRPELRGALQRRPGQHGRVLLSGRLQVPGNENVHGYVMIRSKDYFHAKTAITSDFCSRPIKVINPTTSQIHHNHIL